MLDDACFRFLLDIQAAIQGLAREVELYGAPENTIHYGNEIDALRRACIDAQAMPVDTAAIDRLVTLASATMCYYGDEILKTDLEAAIAEIPPKGLAH
jgi:hypothetical protein